MALRLNFERLEEFARRKGYAVINSGNRTLGRYEYYPKSNPVAIKICNTLQDCYNKIRDESDGRR